MFGYNTREAVRVKVKKCEGKLQPEQRKFSVDPQITSLEVLQSILTKAFDIKSDFSISYKSIDEHGNDVYLPLLSDWDLDAAFLKAHNISVTLRCEPCMQLKVDMKPFAETTEDWEHSATINMKTKDQTTNIVTPDQAETRQAVQTGFPSIIMTQMEKTFNMVTRALNLYDDPTLPPRVPLCDAEFRTFLDPVGHIIHSSKLREVIYCGGIDPSLRKVVWKHILNVYPEGMTGKERMDYIKRKAAEYYALRSCWKECVQKGQVSGDLAYVTSMVRKDVLRTDRHHKFYAGSDDNQNIASLFNILTTYALNHPLVSYCQGMSDLASPLLVTMGDEAHAYVCLCALMARLHPNFQLDGEAMTLKFTHLTESLQVYDPEFYMYLKSQQADDLLFCYRWLLLEMKREFAFEDALRMLEVLWASLPPNPPKGELPLKQKEFIAISEGGEIAPSIASPLAKTPRENAYTKVCAIRRQSSAFSLVNMATNKLSSSKLINYSLDDNAARKNMNHISLRHSKEYQSLDDSALQQLNQNSTIDSKCQQKEFTIKKVTAKNDVHLDADSLRFLDFSHENEDRVSEIDKKLHMCDMKIFSSSTGNLTNGKVAKFPANDHSMTGNHIRDYCQKLPLNNKFFSSLDKLDSNILGNDKGSEYSKPKGKIIKNLNEFFTIVNSNKKQEQLKINPDELLRTMCVNKNTIIWENQSITGSRTSFDEQDLQLIIKAGANKKNTIKEIDKQNTDLYDNSSPDDSQEYYPMTTSMTRELRLELEHLDRQVFGSQYSEPLYSDTPSEPTNLKDKANAECSLSKSNSEISELSDTRAEIISAIKPSKENLAEKPTKSLEDVYLWENPIHKNVSPSFSRPAVASFPHTPDEQAELDFDGGDVTGEIFEESSGKKSVTPIRSLRKIQIKETHDSSLHPNKNISFTESDFSEMCSDVHTKTVQNCKDTGDAKASVGFFSSMSQELESARKTSEAVSSKPSPNLQSITTTISNFHKRYDTVRPSVSNVECDSRRVSLAGDNPFLMFLCLSVLLQHRDYIMRNRMDYNELAMHFDKMVRKHNVNRVLNQARQMYSAYLKQQLKPNVAT